MILQFSREVFIKQIYLLIALAIFPIFLLANQEGKKDKISLHSAAFNGEIEIVKTLISNGARVYAIDNEGRTPLHIVAFNGDKKIAKILISKGANVNSQDKYGETPLHSAAFNGEIEIVKTLISNGADVNVKNKEGKTPLHIALLSLEKVGNQKTEVSISRSEIVKTLILNGANVMNIVVSTEHKINLLTPLHIAAFYGDKELVKILISNGANVNAKDAYGSKTPLHNAAFNGDKKIVKTLISNGARVYAIDNEGRTPLHIALSLFEKVENQVSKASIGRAEVVKTLISNGADVNIVSEATMINLKMNKNKTTCKSRFK